MIATEFEISEAYLDNEIDVIDLDFDDDGFIDTDMDLDIDIP